MTTYIFAASNGTLGSENFIKIAKGVEPAKFALESLKSYIASNDNLSQVVVSEIDSNVIEGYTDSEIFAHITTGTSFDGVFAKDLKEIFAHNGYSQAELLQEFDRFIEVELTDCFALIF